MNWSCDGKRQLIELVGIGRFVLVPDSEVASSQWCVIPSHRECLRVRKIGVLVRRVRKNEGNDTFYL